MNDYQALDRRKLEMQKAMVMIIKAIGDRTKHSHGIQSITALRDTLFRIECIAREAQRGPSDEV